MSDAYSLGQDAYIRGDDIELNPFDWLDAQHDEWEDGYSSTAFADTEHDIRN